MTLCLKDSENSFFVIMVLAFVVPSIFKNFLSDKKTILFSVAFPKLETLSTVYSSSPLTLKLNISDSFFNV